MDKRIIYFLLGIAVFIIIIRPVWAVPILIAVGCLWGISFLFDRSKPVQSIAPSYRSRKTGSQKKRRGSDPVPKNLPGLFADQKLISEISTLTGSREVTKRLIESYRDRFPNESEQWRREKIIYDIKRDRGKI